MMWQFNIEMSAISRLLNEFIMRSRFLKSLKYNLEPEHVKRNGKVEAKLNILFTKSSRF